MTRSSVVRLSSLVTIGTFRLCVARALEAHDAHDDAGGTIGDQSLGNVPQLEPTLSGAPLGRVPAWNALTGQTGDDKIEFDLRCGVRPRDALRQGDRR